LLVATSPAAHVKLEDHRHALEREVLQPTGMPTLPRG
jgi:hypothetical protein